MDILDDYMGTPELSVLEKVKIQAQVLVPVLRTLRAELGTERANQLVQSALREWSAQVFQDIGGQVPGSPRQKWDALTASLMKRVTGAVDLEMLKEEPDAWEFNITRCAYAEFFRQLGEPELGALLTCEMDVDIEAVGGTEVSMTRTQTIMQGAKYCDFRYRMKKGEA